MAKAKKKAANAATKRQAAKKKATDERTPSKNATHEEMMEWRIKMMTKEEDLNPKLKKYVDRSSGPFGSLLRHPLLITQVDPKRAAWVNWCVEHKEKELAKFRAARDWRGVLGCYETPFLVEGFCSELTGCDDASYWELLAFVWTVPEQLWPYNKLFLQFFNSPRPQRKRLMDADEHKALAKLPDTLPVYRGFIGTHGKGLSWTTDKKKAIWFAKRFAVLTRLGEPRLMVGEASKADVLAYFTRRKEAEVVIDPSKVKGKKVVNL